MTNKPKALDYFKKELEQIKDASLQAFFYNSLAVAPESFHNDEELMEYTKKAFYILRGFLEQRQVVGTVREALLGTTLLCDIMFNEFEDDMKSLHTVAVRTYLENRGMNEEVQKGLWENMMRAVEAHNGDKGASPLLDAKPGTAEYELAQAFAVARMPYVHINWEELYNEGNNKKEA
ncbi:TPA: hypothetical protein ACGBET_003446 [Bacillus cereus]